MRRVAAGFVAILTIIPLYFWCVVPWHCNQVSKTMSRALEAALRGDVRMQTLLRDNLGAAEACRTKMPDDASLNITVASTYSMFNKPEEALAVYETALRFDRRPEMYYNRAGIRLRLNDPGGAFEDYLYAARFNPELANRIRNDEIRARVRDELHRIYGNVQ